MSVAERRAMIEPDHAHPSIAAQCRLVSIGRSTFCYRPVPEDAETLALMRAIDEAFLDAPVTAAGRWRGICAARGGTLVGDACVG